MKQKLFQFALLFHPNEKELKDGKRSEVITEVKTIIATDDKTALLLVSRQIPEEYINRLDQVEVVLRPF